jgi:hypothetical protein
MHLADKGFLGWWRDIPFSIGDKAIVDKVEGRVLTVKKVPTVSRLRRKS